MAEQSGWVRVRDAMKYYNVGRATMYRWIKDRKVETRRFGRTIRVRLADPDVSKFAPDATEDETQTGQQRILGIVAGDFTSEYACIGLDQSRYFALGQGRILPPSAASATETVLFVSTKVKALISRFHPTQAAIASAIMSFDALKLGQNRAAQMLAALESHVPVFEYSSMEIYRLVTGKSVDEQALVEDPDADLAAAQRRHGLLLDMVAEIQRALKSRFGLEPPKNLVGIDPQAVAVYAAICAQDTVQPQRARSRRATA